VNLDWFLSQVSSYLSRFYKALVSPEILLTSTEEASADKDVTEAMIFLVISASIAAVGFDFLASSPTDFPKDLISIGLRQVIFAIVYSVEVFFAWWLAGSRLQFLLFLRGTGYYTGVSSVLGMVTSFAFLGAVGALHSTALTQARLSIWSVFINHQEIFSEGFPENWTDLAALALFFLVNTAYLLLIWWRTYRRLSKLGWIYGAWAFVNLLACQSIVLPLFLSLSTMID
jgi:hypothetical protein